jgi:hypothetical protein
MVAAKPGRAEGKRGGRRRALWPGRARVVVCARRGRCPGCRPASRPARGPDLSGAVPLPSPRRANPLARVGPHFRNAAGTGVPARPPAVWRDQKKGQKNVGTTQHHSKTLVVVPVVGLPPVAIRTARVVSMVVPRTAAHDLSRPPDWMLPPSEAMIAQKRGERCAQRGKAPPHPLQSRRIRVPEDRGAGGQS